MIQRIAVVALLLPLLTIQWARAETGVTWIDVRTAQEYASEHVEGAVNIPHDVIDERISELTLDADTPIYVYCRSGGRAGLAADTLAEMGYTEVINLGSLEEAKAVSSEKTVVPGCCS
jgi:phage shock protein E